MHTVYTSVSCLADFLLSDTGSLTPMLGWYFFSRVQESYMTSHTGL